jgi:co-chaperonin GroES (HSP10)
MDADTKDLIERLIAKNPLEPVDDSVIIYRQTLTQTAGGIVVPESTDDRTGKFGYTVMGVVIAVGPGRFVELTGQRVPVSVKPRDRILLTVQAGLELGEVVRKELSTNLGYDKIRLIRAHDIIAKIKPDDSPDE